MLDHATLRTRDLEGTRAFLTTVLDLEPGYRPGFAFPGYWLYANGDPIVHLIPGHGGAVDRGGETIDHVGFRLTDYAGQRRKLEALGVAYTTMDLPELGERRLFVRTPTGILLELVYRDARPAAPSTPETHHDPR
jgi:catechol 2,3-dioxygenase-like lactoylglutathione lyase family enzyme